MARRVVPKRLVPLLGSRVAGEKGDIASMYLEDGYLIVTFVDEEKEPLRVPMDFYSKAESDAKYVTFAGDEVITGKKTMHKIIADGYMAIPTSSPSASLNPPSDLTYLYSGTGEYAEIPSGGVANVYPFSIRNGSRYLGEYNVSLQRWDINFASLFSPYALSTDLNSYVNNATYDSNTKKIYLKNGSTNIAEIDATAFIKDGMVSSVTIEDGYLVISFNTDAGQSPIRIAITKIFNPDNYYTKPDIDTLLGSYVNSLEQGAGNYVIGISKDGNKLSVSRGTLPTKLSDFIDDVVAGNYLPIHGTADKALRLSDDTAHTAWGQTFWQNGVPKTISGSLTSVTNITGSGLITMPKAKFSSSLIIPHVAPSGTLESGETYLYAGTGEYAEVPSGGGVADIYDLTIRKNGTSLGTYNLGNAAADINIPIGWGDLTENSAHRFLTDTMISTWNAKQNAISDLATIRAGAALGATALQSETDPVFSDSAASGITSNDISAWNAKYDKPSGGIPKSDLATSVQTSLGKADTALQSESDPTVPAWAKKTSLAASDVPTLAISKISGLQDALDGKQPLDADLTAIAALTGSGLLRRNSNNTWSLDTNTYLTSSDHKALTLKVGTITIGSDFNSLAAKTYTITKANLTDTIGDTTYAPYNADGYVPTTRTVNGHPLSSDVTVTKGDVGLGNVENTALSTWAGSSYITTLGTITTGTWHGSKIANAYLANSSVTINGKSVSLGGSTSLNLDDIGDGTSKTWDRIVFTDTVQTITGKKTMTNVSVTDYLAVPKIAPASPVTGDIYLWADADGNYSEIPGGGGVADIYDLTLRKNGTSLGTYNLGEQAADINIPIGWTDLTEDSFHKFVSQSEKDTWSAKMSKMQAIPYIEGPTTDTTAGTWTGTYEGITALEEGLTIIYVPHVAGASTTTLNINGLGAKTCYWTGTSKMSTQYPVGTPILLTYHNNGWRRADANTTYSAGTKALFDAGENTSNRVWSAKVLADSVAPKVHTHTWSDITDGADVLSGYLPLSGGELIGNLSMGRNAIINIGSLSAPPDETFSISGVQSISFAIGGAFLPLPGIVKDGNHLVFYTGYADVHDTVGEDLYHLKLTAAEEGSGEDWGGGSYKIYDESNLSLATLAGSSAIGSTSQPVYYNGSALAACNLGTASQKDAVTTIISGGAGLPTADAIYTFVNNAVTAAQPYKGVSSTAVTDGGTEMPTISGYITRTKGDVVAYNKKEFIWEGDKWRELGDEGSYALKTVQIIAGTGLAGGGAISQDVTLSLSSATIASLGLADSALQASDLDGYVNAISQGTGNYVTGITKSGKTLTITRATLPTTIALSNVTGADDLKAIEALTGTSGFLKKTAANTWTLDTNTYLTSASHKALTLKVGSITIGSDYNSLAAKTYTITKANLTDTIGTTTYAPYHADGYLPLSGGTLTGALYTQHILPSSALGGYNIGSETAPFGSGYFSGSLLAEESVETYDVIAHGTADLSVRLAIPTSAPTSPASGKTYLWASSLGEYAETPSGGGTATVYDLTIRKNGTSLGTVNLGEQAGNINIPVGWSDLTPDASHRFLTDSLISTWNAKQDAISDLATIRSNASHGNTAYGWGNHASAGYLTSVAFSDLTSHPNTLAGYGITDAIPYSEILSTVNAFDNRHLWLHEVSNTFWAANLRYDVTLTGFRSGTAADLFDGSFETQVQVAQGGTGVITIAGKNGSRMWGGGFPYGYLEIAFYYIAIPESVSVRVYSNNGSQTGWYNISMTNVDRANNRALYRGYNSDVYGVTTVEITVVAKESYSSSSYNYAGVTQVSFFQNRGTLPEMAVFNKSIAQTLYHNLTAPKYIVTGGTSSQFLKADGSLDSNTYALSSALNSYVPTTRTVNNKPLSGNITLTLDDIGNGSTRSLANYVLKAGDTMTGNLIFNVSSATRNIYYKASDAVSYRGIIFGTNGDLTIGYDGPANSRSLYLDGFNEYLRFGATRQYSMQLKSDGTIGLSGISAVLPVTANEVNLGSSARAFNNIYGKLDLSYLQSASDLKAIEALTGTGLAKRTADNTWELTDTADKAEELATSTEEDAMFTYRQVPSEAVGDVLKATAVKGKSVVWNQLLPELVSTNWRKESGVSMTDGTGYATIAVTTTNHGIYVPFTFIVGHKYYLTCSARSSSAFTLRQGTASSGVSMDLPLPSTNVWTRGAGVRTCTHGGSLFYCYPVGTGTFDLKDFACIDLTLAGLDDLTAAEFEALYPDYHAYNAGELVNNAASGVEMVGFNLLKLVGRTRFTDAWTRLQPHNFSEDKYIIGYTADDYYRPDHIKGYDITDKRVSVTSASPGYGIGFPIKCQPNTDYCIQATTSGDATARRYIGFYDNTGIWLGWRTCADKLFTTPDNCYWMVLCVRTESSNQTAIYEDICINISDPSRNGEYQPYNSGTLSTPITEIVPADKPTVRLNQLALALDNSWGRNSITYTYSDGVITMTATGTGTGAKSIYCNTVPGVSGHKYFFRYEMKADAAMKGGYGYAEKYAVNVWDLTTEWKTYYAIDTGRGTAGQAYVYGFFSDLSIKVYVRSVEVIDLTEMYGAGSEPTSTAEVEELIGSGYIPYTTGEDIPNRIFPVGMKSAGSVADEWSGNTATRRIGVVDLGTLTWSKQSSGIGTADGSKPFFFASLINKGNNAQTLSDKYITCDWITFSNGQDKAINTFWAIGGSYVNVRDSSYTSATDFKAAMSGVLLYYELKEPETYTVDALPDTLVPFESGGTMRRLPVDTSEEVIAPMVCDFQYGANMSDVTKAYLPLSGGTLMGALNSQNILPSATATYDLGSYSKRFKDIYLAGTATVNGITSSGNILPSSTSLTLGSSSTEWGSLYVGSIFASGEIRLSANNGKVVVEGLGGLSHYNDDEGDDFGLVYLGRQNGVEKIFVGNDDEYFDIVLDGHTYAFEADVAQSLAIPKSAPSYPDANKVYLYCDTTGNYYQS